MLLTPCLMRVSDLIVAVSSVIVMLAFLAPTGFEATFTRRQFNKNESVKNQEWPWSMKVRLNSFLCSTPSPNFDVDDQQLIAAWFLPPKSHLSPIMRQIGQCKTAAKAQRQKGNFSFDLQKCYCVDGAWVIVIFVVASLSVICFVVGCFRDMVAGPGQQLVKMRRARRHAWLWSIVWYVALCVFALHKQDAGVWYQVYGDMYPQAYYDEPDTWFAVYILCLINGSLEGIKFALCSSAVRKLNAQEIAREIDSDDDDSPPAYESVWKKKGVKV